MSERAEGAGAPRPRWRRAADLAIAALLALCFWASRYEAVESTATPDLDPSWQQAKAYELVHGLRAGVDTVFTFGPLGWFYTSRYEPALLGWKAAWELGLGLALAGFLGWALLVQRGVAAKIAFAAALLVSDGSRDAHYLLALLALGTWLAASPSRPLGARAAVYVLGSLVALVKFTWFVYAALCVAGLAAARGRERSVRAAAAELALATGAFVLVWTAVGQSPADLGSWLLTSSWISSGYNASMGLAGPQRELLYALAALALAALALAAEAAGSERGPRRIASLALCLAGVLLAFKGGMVRAATSAGTFLCFAAAAPFLVAPSRALEGPFARRARAVATAAKIACAAVALHAWGVHVGRPPGPPLARVAETAAEIGRGARAIAAAGADRERLAYVDLKVREYLAMPRVRERAGREGVDVFFYGTSIALVNDLAWRPRPVFQSYSAYTPRLAALNARFLAGERAPRFVLLRMETSDERLPGIEDGPAQLVLFGDYEPALAEDGWLLLERAPDAPREARRRAETALDRTVRFGEPIEIAALEGRALVLEAQIDPTALGLLAGTLLRGPKLEVEVVDGSGAVRRFRVSPSLLECGALVRPFLDSQDRWYEAACGVEGPGLERLTFLAPPGSEKLFERTLRVRISRLDRLLREPDPAKLEELRWSSFETRPARATSPRFPVRRQQVGGREVLVASPPGEVAFTVAPGSRIVRGRYGVLPDAARFSCATPVWFRLVLRAPDGTERVIGGRRLAPHELPEDRRIQSFELAFEADQPCELILQTSLEDPTAFCDGTYWTAIALD